MVRAVFLYRRDVMGRGMAATDIERGLSTAEVEERIAAGKINRNMELKTKSVKELIIENLCTLFNLINAVLAILVLLTGSFKNLTFLFVVFLNTAIGVIQSMRSKKMVDKLTLLTSKKAIAVRDGAEVELDLDQIVLDDIIRLGRGDQIPADAVVVSGEALVNESLLTGESDLIKKQPGSELMSGSFIDSGLLRARVIHVGADNYVAKINNEAKYVKKVNSEIMNALNAVVRFASLIMIPLGLALFASSVSELWDAAGTPGDSALSWCFSELLAGRVPSSALLSTVGALLGMIPQGLVLLTSSVLAIATVRLARRKVLAQQLYCIETLARVDVLCLDKTGTITSGRMEVEGTYPLPIEGAGMGAGESEVSVPVEATVLDFALANVARATSADANETCQALLNYYADRPVEVSEPLAVIPFSSSKKWSGASFAQGSYVMGAAQFVLSERAFSQVENRVAELADTCRVLVVARVDGFTPDGDMVGEAEPVGFVTIRDEIRTSAAETIGYFNEQGVTLNVISGDDPRTVSSIARVVGVPGPMPTSTPRRSIRRPRLMRRWTLSRLWPRDAATEARTRAGAQASRPYRCHDGRRRQRCAGAQGSRLLRGHGRRFRCRAQRGRNCAGRQRFCLDARRGGRGRRSINNLQRSAALFLTKTLFSMGLAALCIAFPPYPFEPIQMTLINFFCIGAPGFVLGLEPNNARVKGSFLTNVLKRALPASLAVIMAAALDIFVARVFGFNQLTLSTMCLLTSCAASVSLIWRISQPLTPLRVVLFVFVVVGILVGVIGFPELLSIANLSMGEAVILLAIVVFTCTVFFKLATMMDSLKPRRRHAATGFGRGVRVRLGRGGGKGELDGFNCPAFCQARRRRYGAAP